MTLDYGMGEKNPIEKVKVYHKDMFGQAIQVEKHDVSEW